MGESCYEPALVTRRAPVCRRAHDERRRLARFDRLALVAIVTNWVLPAVGIAAIGYFQISASATAFVRTPQVRPGKTTQSTRLAIVRPALPDRAGRAAGLHPGSVSERVERVAGYPSARGNRLTMPRGSQSCKDDLTLCGPLLVARGNAWSSMYPTLDVTRERDRCSTLARTQRMVRFFRAEAGGASRLRCGVGVRPRA